MDPFDTIIEILIYINLISDYKILYFILNLNKVYNLFYIKWKQCHDYLSKYVSYKIKMPELLYVA